MEVKKVVEDLELVNDVNTLSIEDLAEKYLTDEESYKKFITKYGDFFINNPNYRCRVLPLFKKISLFIESGNEKYPEPEFYEKKGVIEDRMNKTLNEANGDSNYTYEEIYNFIFTIGANKVPGDCNLGRYYTLVKGVCEASKKYDRKDGSIHDFLTTMYSNLNDIYSREDMSNFVSNYLNTHSLARECNDTNYLYFVNYMLANHTSEIDSTFIEDAQDVMKVSELLNKMTINFFDCNYEDYKKVADKTKKNINYYLKCKNNKENISKRKIKQLFT